MTGSAQADIRNLARFRYAIRKFLRSSDEAARKAGLTPQQHQVLLGIAGFTSKGSATIGELAEFLQLRHHSVVGLVDRAEAMGLVRRAVNDSDRREVHVSLTSDGLRKLRTLTELHRKELYTMRRGVNLPHLESAPTRREVGKGRAAGRRTTRGS
jgi:DNA-binding MarR family transcriptional regulator